MINPIPNNMSNDSLNNNSNNHNIIEPNENNDKLIKFKFSDFQNKKTISEKLGKELYIIINEDKNTGQQIKDFIIYSTISDLKELIEKKIEFSLVDKEFLEKNKCSQNAYIGKEVIYYESDNKKCFIFPKEKNNNNILEIIDENNSNLNENTKLKKLRNIDNNNSLEGYKEEKTPQDGEENYIENKEMILKKLILLYAFEKHFVQLMKSPIKDEYDVNEYYLINKNWINLYKSDYYMNYIYPLLNNMEKQLSYPFSYKGYLINIEHIINKLKTTQNFISYLNEIEKSINNNNKVLSKEGNFIPNYNKQVLISNEKVKFPIEFILVPEKLFDLFYKVIEASKYTKDDYKYNVLIGDNVLFIQNKKYNTIFNSYILSKNNNRLEMSYLFMFNESNKLYREVREFIKGKDFINYIIERQLVYNKISTFYELLEDNNKIGYYINFNSSLDIKIKKFKAKQYFYKCKNIFSLYNEFMKNLLKLKDNKIILSNDINNMSNIDFKPVFVVIEDNWKKCEKYFLFDNLKIISQDKNKEQSENNFIQQLINNNNNNNNNLDFKSLSKYLKLKINIIDQMTFDMYTKNNNSFYLLSKDILLKMNNDKDFIDSIQKKEELLFFFNNNEYFILNRKSNKLYKAIFLSNDRNEFKIKEYEFNLEFKNVIQNIKNLIRKKNVLDYYINLNLFDKNNIKFFKYYLINKNWMNYYKNFYQYDYITQNINKSEIELLSIFKNKNCPDYLKNSQNLYPESQNVYPNDSNSKFPLNFEIVEKDIFESIISDLNKQNNINLIMNQCYDIMLGDKKLFIQNNPNNNMYYIYSSKNDKYELEYIMILNNEDLFNLIKKNEKNTFEEILLEYGIDLKKKIINICLIII